MKLINKICAPARWKQFFLIGALAEGLLPFIVKAMVFYIKQRGLSLQTDFYIDCIGIFIGLVFAVLAFVSYRNQFTVETQAGKRILQWWFDALVLVLFVIALNILPMLAWQYLGNISPLVAMIGGCLLYVILGIICMRQMIILVFDLQAGDVFAKKNYLIRRAFKKPLSLLLTIAVCLWFVAGKKLVELAFLLVSLDRGSSFALQIAGMLTVILINTFVLIGYLSYVKAIRTSIYPEDMQIRNVSMKIPGKVFVIVATLALVIIVGVNKTNQMEQNQPERVDDYVTAIMDEARKEIDYKRTDEAIRIYAQVEEYMGALSAYAEEDRDTVFQYMTTYGDDEFFWRLYYTMTDNVYFAREALLQSEGNLSLCHDILRYYADEETDGEDEKESKKESKKDKDKDEEEEVEAATEEAEETEKPKDSDFTLTRREKKELIKDCLEMCLAEGAFVDSTVKFDTDSLRKKTINDMRKRYNDNLVYNDLLAVLQASAAKGSVDEETVYKLLDLADANPDNMFYQLMAVMSGAQYLPDNAKHYNRVVDCAIRLDTLLVEENRNVEVLVEEKLYLAQMMLNCKKYTTALDFLDEVRLLGNTDVEDAILMCYQKLNDNASILTYVEELRNQGGDRAILDYYMALASLKTKNVDDALKNGVMLAEKVAKAGEDRENVNALLFNFAEYLCISDKYQNYIDYYYRVNSYTEEQQAILDQSLLLSNYVAAMNGIYNSRNYETAITSLEAIESEYPGLSKTWYLKGTAYFDKRDYDNAIDCFNKCVAIDEDNLTAVYSLAALYDTKGEYEKAFKLCEQLVAALPVVNHDQDWYGIAYHANAMYQKLKNHVGGTK